VEAEYEDSLVGRTIAGKYAIVAFLGGGSMGKVYQARQLGLDKPVAVKVMNQKLARDEAFAVRFYREAKAAARLDHPNSTRVLDFGEEPDGLLYIAMEYLDGRDLEQVILRESPLDCRRIAMIANQMLSAIAVAHDVGIIHRDLKPENVMLIRGVDEEGAPREMVKVCDFGIAKLVDRTTDGPARTTSGLVVGTPEYMSPEQGKGESVDARSDLYSVGVLLYEMITGVVPFVAETPIAIVFRHVTEEPKAPSALRPDVDARLEQICLRALQKNKDNRFQTAREMRAALRAILRVAEEGVLVPVSQPLRMPVTAPPVARTEIPPVVAAPPSRAALTLVPWVAAVALAAGAIAMHSWANRFATGLPVQPPLAIVAPPPLPQQEMTPPVAEPVEREGKPAADAFAQPGKPTARRAPTAPSQSASPVAGPAESAAATTVPPELPAAPPPPPLPPLPVVETEPVDIGPPPAASTAPSSAVPVEPTAPAPSSASPGAAQEASPPVE
jgi:serine/threonine-protein kinase